jgi:hypothetical protein
MEGWEVVTDEEEGRLCTTELSGAGAVCCTGRTRDEERRLPRVFIDKAGRTHVEEARLRLGGGTTKAMTKERAGYTYESNGRRNPHQKSDHYVMTSECTGSASRHNRHRLRTPADNSSSY